VSVVLELPDEAPDAILEEGGAMLVEDAAADVVAELPDADAEGTISSFDVTGVSRSGGTSRGRVSAAFA
jgi:hypothetical protein